LLLVTGGKKMPLNLGSFGQTGIVSRYANIESNDVDSNHPSVDIGNPAHRSPQVLEKLRGRLLTVSWAGVAFVATAVWLYMITVAGWSIVEWFVG
jgi:hypothetical protein